MKKIVLMLLCTVLMFGGCSAKEDNIGDENIAGAQVGQADKINKKDDKDLTMIMRSVSTLNPLLNQDSSIDVILRMVFKPLIKFSNDYKPEASIAESWYYSEEGTVLTVNIKSGLYWHNGQEITADDLVFSYNTLVSADDNAVYKDCIERMSSVEKTGKYSVEINFSEAYCGNVYTISFPLIPESYYGNPQVSDADKNFKPVGNGVYGFESYTVAKELILKARENSFSAKPQIDIVVVKITNNEDTDVFSFNQRLIDCVVADEKVLGKVDLNNEANKYSYIDNYYDFIGFNFNNDILNQKLIRQAIAYSVPLASIIEGVYLSDAVAAGSPLNPESWLSESINYPNDYTFNLTKARQLLDEAGFIISDGETVRSKVYGETRTPLNLTILVNSENAQRCQAAVKIAEELNGIGFSVDIDKVDFNEYVSRLENGQFDLFMGGWELSMVPEFGFMFESTSNMNFINYESETMDSLLEKYRTSVSDATMKASMNQLAIEINEELPYLSLVFRKASLFTDSRIKGIINPLQFNSLNEVENWIID